MIPVQVTVAIKDSATTVTGQIRRKSERELRGEFEIIANHFPNEATRQLVRYGFGEKASEIYYVGEPSQSLRKG